MLDHAKLRTLGIASDDGGEWRQAVAFAATLRVFLHPRRFGRAPSKHMHAAPAVLESP
ncbi:MAG: hypothetical protein ABJC66_17125 [Gammaproteobacteria bacterium]